MRDKTKQALNELHTVIDRRTFAPLIETCHEYGICRTVAFELAASGMLETFRIGKRRYVKMESLRTLPERITEHDARTDDV